MSKLHDPVVKKIICNGLTAGLVLALAELWSDLTVSQRSRLADVLRSYVAKVSSLPSGRGTVGSMLGVQSPAVEAPSETVLGSVWHLARMVHHLPLDEASLVAAAEADEGLIADAKAIVGL